MRLKELREERGFTQSEVAKAIGGTQSNLAKWEKETVQPSAEFIIKLSNFFGVSTDYLLGRTDDLGIMVPLSVPSHLSYEEQKLLEGYRKLPPNLQQTIQELIEFGSQSNSAKRKGEIK